MSPKNCSLAYDLSSEPNIDIDEEYEPKLVLLKSDETKINKAFSSDAPIRIQGKVTISF